ncbi:MAG: hypothetical protein R3D66_06575 [Alphaproteobacteria bacterium]
MLTLYVGLELQSLLCALAAFHRNAVRSAEAGLKYFVLGALFGDAFVRNFIALWFYRSIDFGAIGASC